MKGYIRQKYKVNISQRRISIALQMATPQYHQRRQTNTARLTNPIPHKADYFGLQLHIDQNEKRRCNVRGYSCHCNRWSFTICFVWSDNAS